MKLQRSLLYSLVLVGEALKFAALYFRNSGVSIVISVGFCVTWIAYLTLTSLWQEPRDVFTRRLVWQSISMASILVALSHPTAFHIATGAAAGFSALVLFPSLTRSRTQIDYSKQT